MAEDLLLEAYVGMITEAPVDDIGQIKSTHFTTKHPRTAKFKPGDKVLIGYDTHMGAPALKKFPVGTIGKIVGMQHNSGAGASSEYSKAHGSNRYYVRMPDNKIYPVPSTCIINPDTIPAVNPHLPPDHVPPDHVPPQKTSVAATAPKALNKDLDTIIDSVDLGDFIHTIREYFYQLSPEQQQQMASFLRDSISPE